MTQKHTYLHLKKYKIVFRVFGIERDFRKKMLRL